jgi:hypothetical protein
MVRGLLPVLPITIDIHETGLAVVVRYELRSTTRYCRLGAARLLQHAPL